MYIQYLFKNIDNPDKLPYSCDYEYYGVEDLENYVTKHNEKREKELENAQV